MTYNDYNGDEWYRQQQAPDFSAEVAKLRAAGATATQAYRESLKKPKEIIPDILSASTTNLAGKTTVGKSWFASYIATRMVRGEQVAGRDVADGVWRPLILGTDSDPKDEYSERIRSVLNEEEAENVFILPTTAIKTPRKWEFIHEFMRMDGYNFLIVDNLTQIIGDTNSNSLVNEYYDSLKMFNESRWPVLTLTHQSEKGWGETRTHKGSSDIAISARHNLYAYKEGRRLFVSTQTNVNGAEDRRLTFLAKPGANFELIEEITEEERRQRKEERKARKPKSEAPSRTDDTLKRNEDYRAYVIAECQGLNASAVAKKLKEKFPDGPAADTLRVQLSGKKSFATLLENTADNQWSVKPS